MRLIELTISIDTNNPKDIINQGELLEIYDNFKSYDAKPVPFEMETTPQQATAKSTSVNMIMGAVSVSLPVASIVTVLTSFLKHYFDSRKRRSIKIKHKDGTIIHINGYSESETEKLIQKLTTQK